MEREKGNEEGGGGELVKLPLGLVVGGGSMLTGDLEVPHRIFYYDRRMESVVLSYEPGSPIAFVIPSPRVNK